MTIGSQQKKQMHTVPLLLFILIVGFLPAVNHAQELIVKEPVRYLALGDSYTIGESVPETERWSRQLFN